jgi:hypothetical protein
LHLVLTATVLLSNLPLVAEGLGLGALGLHFRARHPVRDALLVVSGRARFALPAEGRFDLGLGADTRFGAFWAELHFSDCPTSRFLIVRDQLSEPDWRRLGLMLREGL